MTKLQKQVCETQDKLDTLRNKIGHFSVRNINKREEAARQKILALRNNNKHALQQNRNLNVKVNEQNRTIKELNIPEHRKRCIIRPS